MISRSSAEHKWSPSLSEPMVLSAAALTKHVLQFAPNFPPSQSHVAGLHITLLPARFQLCATELRSFMSALASDLQRFCVDIDTQLPRLLSSLAASAASQVHWLSNLHLLLSRRTSLRVGHHVGPACMLQGTAEQLKLTAAAANALVPSGLALLAMSPVIPRCVSCANSMGMPAVSIVCCSGSLLALPHCCVEWALRASLFLCC